MSKQQIKKLINFSGVLCFAMTAILAYTFMSSSTVAKKAHSAKSNLVSSSSSNQLVAKKVMMPSEAPEPCGCSEPISWNTKKDAFGIQGPCGWL